MNPKKHKKTLIIDNYDSFVYNLYQTVAKLKGNPEVFRNDEIKVEDILEKNYSHIIFSPGPGSPENPKDVGVSLDILKNINLPIFGVCLGFQTIAYFYGEKIIHAPKIFHGKTSEVFLTKKGKLSPIFKGIPNSLEVMRYHSLISEKVPKGFACTSETEDKIIMSFENIDKKIFGVQFHPESFATKYGEKMIKNFLDIT